MLKLVCGAALAAVLAAPAMAQEKGEYRNPTRVTGPDMAIVQEAADALDGGAECNAVFTVGTDGKPKDVEPNCSDARYDPYVVRAVESMEYLPEIFDGELFDHEGLKQPFTFAGAVADNSVPPKVKTEMNGRDVSRAINRVDEEGVCAAVYTVGADGKPKDIETNCEPSAYDSYIEDVIENMEYEPGTRDGQAVDWPGVEFPLKLSDPNK